MLLFVGFWVGDGSFLEMAGRSAMVQVAPAADFGFFKSLLKELFINAGVEFLAWYRLASSFGNTELQLRTFFSSRPLRNAQALYPGDPPEAK